MSTMILNDARRALGAFARSAANTIAAQNGLDDDQTRGLRNLVSTALRDGGKKTKGFYGVLPSGDGKVVEVSEAVFTTAQNTARHALKVLIAAIAAAGSRQVKYSTGAKAAKGKPGDDDYQPAVKGHNVYFDIEDTTEWEPLDDETVDTLMEAAIAGGSTVSAELADLDF